MSGGSFSYLCYAAGNYDELIQKQYDLVQMTEFLESNFPGTQAAKDTRKVCDEIVGHLANRHEASAVLENVWQAVEWWQSGDSIRDDAVKAVTEYGMRSVPKQLMSWVPRQPA